MRGRGDELGSLSLRVFAAGAAFFALAMTPLFLATMGRTRQHPIPINVRRQALLDGSIAIRGSESPSGRPLIVRAMRVDGGPELRPASLPVSRDILSLPPGTRLTYFVTDEQGRDSVLSGVVSERNSAAGESFFAGSRAAVGMVFVLSGVLISLAGAEKRAVLAGAALAGIGLTFESVMLEPCLVAITDVSVRNAATVLWQAFPRDLTYLLMVRLLMTFPGAIPDNRVLRGARIFLAAGAVVRCGLLTAAQIRDLLERVLTVTQQVRLVRIDATIRLALVVVATVSCLYLISRQVRLYRSLALSRADRRRARLVGWSLVVGALPGLAAAAGQAAGLLAGRPQPISTPGILLMLLPVVLIPIGLLYSILTPQYGPLRVFVRRAAVFSLSEKSVRIAAFAPLVLLLIFGYFHRDAQMSELLSSNGVFIALTGAATVAGLLYRDRARHALEGVFFRDRADARRLMAELAEKSRAARDPASLEQLLSGEIGRALHAESVALFVRDRVSGAFACPSRNLPTLDADSVLIGAAGTKGVLDLDPTDRRSPLGSLPEIERHWVEASHARLVLPLAGAEGGVIGLLAVGENLSELPWDKDDKSLLVAAAASGALALENSLLRSSGGGGAAPGRPAATHEEEDLARTCHLCSQIFSAALGPLCPKDQVPLAVADVPHVLAGKYRFERRIGSGGMGVVYLARDLSLGRFVAVKTLPKVSPEAAMRLRREARATARVLHPNLAVIFAAETWHGTPMLMLEYLEGGTLAPRIARGPIPIAHVLEWGIALSGALEAAHAKGVLHRDIKPSNIGFTASDEPKLLDFGLASLLEEPELLAAVETTGPGFDALETVDLKHKTVSGRIVGTVPYLAPEAILGQPPQVSFDLWSLALTLYEATTGTNPFLEMPAEKTLNRILTQTPPRARDLRAECPEGLSDLFANALALKPAQRPRTARELHRALRALASAAAA